MAQWKVTGVELSAMPGLGLHQYKEDSLIFERRRGQGTVSGSVHFPVMLHFENGSRSSVQAGAGIRLDDFTMNKYNFSDVFFSLIVMPWGGNLNDTFALQQIRFTNLSVIVPLAYCYRLSRPQSKGVVFQVRALLVPGYAFQRKATITADSSRTPLPTTFELKQLGDYYGEQSKKFSLFFAPEINLRSQERPGKLGFYMGLQPFGFDLAQPTRRFFSGGGYLRAALGISYHWK